MSLLVSIARVGNIICDSMWKLLSFVTNFSQIYFGHFTLCGRQRNREKKHYPNNLTVAALMKKQVIHTKEDTLD